MDLLHTIKYSDIFVLEDTIDKMALWKNTNLTIYLLAATSIRQNGINSGIKN